jgi:pimeloyl-ACP methyl ester carboxylesterase
MLSRRVRIAQLLELCAYLALGTWLASRGWHWAAVALAALALAAGWRIGVLHLSFALSWLLRSPREVGDRIGAARALRMLARESGAFLMFNLLHCPWDALAIRRDPEPVPTDRTPVVLAHGYFANRGYFHELLRRLEAAGVGPIFTPNLRAFAASIERYEEELHAEIERVARGTGRRVVLIAHSMGGLAARLYLARRGTARVERLITIACPHHGTALAPFGTGENARQMRPGSPFLRELASREGARGPGIPAVSLYSPHDNMVFPQATSRLPWAENIAIPGQGHLCMIGAEGVAAAILERLRPDP